MTTAIRRELAKALGLEDKRPTPKKAKQRAAELQAAAGPDKVIAVPDNTGRYQVADVDPQDYADRPKWFELMTAIDRLADPLLPTARTVALVPDYRRAHTIARAELASVALAELIHELRASTPTLNCGAVSKNARVRALCACEAEVEPRHNSPGGWA